MAAWQRCWGIFGYCICLIITSFLRLWSGEESANNDTVVEHKKFYRWERQETKNIECMRESITKKIEMFSGFSIFFRLNFHIKSVI